MGSREPVEPGEDLPLRLRAALAARAPDAIVIDGFRRAAVLVPLVRRDGEWRLVLTERSASLRTHGGQVSFPGGVVDASETPEQAAVREAEEEIGLEPARVTCLGRLGDVPTPTEFVITPVVAAVVPPPERYRRNPIEVAEVFELALDRFREPGVLQRGGEVERWGRVFVLLQYRVDGKNVWGATARMVQELLELLPSLGHSDPMP